MQQRLAGAGTPYARQQPAVVATKGAYYVRWDMGTQTHPVAALEAQKELHLPCPKNCEREVTGSVFADNKLALLTAK